MNTKMKLITTATSLGFLLASWGANAERLNVRDADIREVVETVARITGKNMIIDPRVSQKKITIISNQDSSKDEIYRMFLSALKIHGFQAITVDNKTIKIIQEAKARAEPGPVNVKDHAKYGDSYVTQVIPVHNVNAQQMVNVLRPMISATSGQMVAVQGTNTLIVHDSASNVKRLQDIIARTDKANDEDIEMITLQHASASEVVRILESINKGAAGQQQVNQTREPKFVADERMNSILLSATDKTRVRLRALIVSLDRPQNSSGNTKTLFLKYAKAEDIKEVLSGIGEYKQKEEAGGSGAQAGAGRSQKSLYSIQAHEETNALVMTAPPDMMREFEMVVRSLDIRRKQVHVEAIIVEISDRKARELGIQWLFSPAGSGTQPAGIINFGGSGVGIGSIAGGVQAGRDYTEETVTTDTDGFVTGTVSTTVRGDGGTALSQVLAGLSGAGIGLARTASSGLNWGAFINALEGVTDSNTLARPSITTLDNTEAEFSAGQEIPIITGSTLGGNNANPFQNVERKDIGVSLKIKPQINEGNHVRLDIEQEVSSLAGATAVDVVTNKRKVKTSVLVPDGGMVVLGGLIDDTIDESSQQVPLLGDIPILGNLFKSRGTTKSKRNLMIFIHPRVLKDDLELRQISSSKYSYMRAQQIKEANEGISLMPGEDAHVMPTYDEALLLPPSFEDYLDEESKKDGKE